MRTNLKVQSEEDGEMRAVWISRRWHIYRCQTRAYRGWRVAGISWSVRIGTWRIQHLFM